MIVSCVVLFLAILSSLNCNHIWYPLQHGQYDKLMHFKLVFWVVTGSNDRYISMVRYGTGYILVYNRTVTLNFVTLVSSLSRHLWNGLRGRGWEIDVQGQLPLHVSGEERQWYKQCSQIPPPRPGGRHPVHLSAPVILFQCLCPLWWGETGHHEGKVPLQRLLHYFRPTATIQTWYKTKQVKHS